MDREIDTRLIESIPQNKIADFIFMQLRNLWTVDGLYYMGIEKQFGTQEATRIDQFVWEVMGKIEARKIKQFFKMTGSDIPSMMKALQFTGWALDLEDKEIEIHDDTAILRNVKCRVQQTRIGKGLGEFGCKPVRFGFLKAFAQEFNSNIIVKCHTCPPDDHSQDIWCEWEFTMKEE